MIIDSTEQDLLDQQESRMYPKGIDTYNRILEAARLLFYEKGPDSTAMSEIAEMAFVQRSTISHYFRNKDMLLMEVANEILSYNDKDAHSISEDERLIPVLRNIIACYKICADRKYARFTSDYLTYYNIYNGAFHSIYLDYMVSLYRSIYGNGLPSEQVLFKMPIYHFVNIGLLNSILSSIVENPNSFDYTVKNIKYLVANERYFEQIKSQLITNGVASQDIIIYR